MHYQRLLKKHQGKIQQVVLMKVKLNDTIIFASSNTLNIALNDRKNRITYRFLLLHFCTTNLQKYTVFP